MGQFLAYVADADIPALLGKEALGTLGCHFNFRRRVLTLEALGADIPLDVNAAGHYLLNASDFRESRNVRTPGRRTNCCAKRVASGKRMVRNDALFLMDVTSETKMRPAGRCGPSLTSPCLGTLQLELGRQHPGGKILPPLRLGGATSKPTLASSVGPSQCSLGFARWASKRFPYSHCPHVDDAG